MKAIILAGGKGTRLKSVIRDVPKPMAPVAGKPFLGYLIEQLRAWAIKDIILSVGYKNEVIKEYFSTGSQLGVKIDYAVEKSPLGTGGAIRTAMKLVDDSDVIVMNGDSFFDVDFMKLINFHTFHNATVMIALRKMNDTSRYGRVIIDKKGEVADFREKQGNSEGLTNTGIYVVNRSIRPYLAEGVLSFEKDVMPNMIGKGLYGMTQKGFFVDIGIPGDYLNLCDHPQRLAVRNKNENRRD